MADTEIPPRLSPRRILIIEDDAAMAALLRYYFEHDAHATWQVTIESTLQEALTSLTTHQPAIVLLDLNLPDSRESATLRRLLTALPIAPLTPVVVVTGMPPTEMQPASLALGAGFVGKDQLMNDPHAFLQMVHALVGGNAQGQTADA